LGHEIDGDDNIVVRMKADGAGSGHRSRGFWILRCCRKVSAPGLANRAGRLGGFG
jgi:hypothetical protein